MAISAVKAIKATVASIIAARPRNSTPSSRSFSSASSMPTSSSRVCKMANTEPMMRRNGLCSPRCDCVSIVMAVGVARDGLRGACKRARQEKLTGQACTGQLDSLVGRTQTSGSVTVLLAVDQQPQQHASTRCDADGRPWMLMHVVVGGAGGLLAFFDHHDLDVSRLFLRLLQTRKRRFTQLGSALAGGARGLFQQIFSVREDGFDIRHQSLLVDFRH